ncbi:MAG: DNA ligase D [Planctomycetaceae bacterium]|nr:DNA ligase D [Planctomycetaceae bacterium]
MRRPNRRERIHYDFRLEHDGVLLSWAVPKGPSLDPSQKRLAVQVEDHPLAYAGFEGVIPAGEYGGGSVIVWDQGTYEPEGEISKMLAKGHLKFRLDGTKLKGNWNLVRTGGRSADGKNWLLIKIKDDAVVPLSKGDVLAERPASVLSGRTVEEIAAAPDRVWKGGKAVPTKPTAAQQRKNSKPQRSKWATRLRKITGAASSKLPATIPPQLATLADRAPEGDEWLHEIKYDGYRLLAKVDDRDVTLFTRGGHDWTGRFREIAAAIASLPCRSAWIDGEAASPGLTGVTSFSEMQAALSIGSTGQLVFFAFDLLFLDGFDLRRTPLAERKVLLASLLQEAPSRVQYVEHVSGDGPSFTDAACQAGLEGIISKRADAPHRGGRTKTWLKAKCRRSYEFLVGGFTGGAGSRTGFGSLLLGKPTDGGQVIYAGRVGTGFDERTLIDLRQRLDPLVRKTSPFTKKPPDAGKDVRWTEPSLMVEVAFADRTADGLLRHATYRGLRDDKSPATAEIPANESRQSRPAKAKNQRRQTAAAKTEALTAEHLAGLAGVRMTNPERVLYPDVGLTKLDLAKYVASIAEWILPEVADRPLSLLRCPKGTGGECFFQKHADRATPESVERLEVEGDGKPHLVVRDLAGLVSLVQMGVLEIHPWGSRADRPERPDRLIIDLDPGDGVAWSEIVAAASLVRARLDAAGLVSFVKTTGGKGLHVVVPLDRRHEWDEVKSFARRFAERLGGEYPRQFVATSAKAARKGRIYVDYLRNGRGATAVAAYAPRARPGATVATPLAWAELTPQLRPEQFTVLTVRNRLAALKEDPWAELHEARQSLTAKARKSVGL